MDRDSQVMRRPCISLLRTRHVAEMVVRANFCLGLLLLPSLLVGKQVEKLKVVEGISAPLKYAHGVTEVSTGLVSVQTHLELATLKCFCGVIPV